MKYCVVFLCFLDSKRLEDIIFTDDYNLSLYDYFCAYECDGLNCNDYAIIYNCITGEKLGEGFVGNLIYEKL